MSRRGGNKNWPRSPQLHTHGPLRCRSPTLALTSMKANCCDAGCTLVYLFAPIGHVADPESRAMLDAGCRAVHRRPQPPPVPACEQLRSTGKIMLGGQGDPGRNSLGRRPGHELEARGNVYRGPAVNVSVNYVEC